MPQIPLSLSRSSIPSGTTSVVVTIRPSVLRLGLGARLVGAACLVVGIWAVIGWVLR